MGPDIWLLDFPVSIFATKFIRISSEQIFRVRPILTCPVPTLANGEISKRKLYNSPDIEQLGDKILEFVVNSHVDDNCLLKVSFIRSDLDPRDPDPVNLYPDPQHWF